MALPITTKITKAKRGRASATTQLGAKQCAILDWLLTRETEIQATGDEQQKLILEARGVPWNVKALCKAHPDFYKPDGTPDRSRASTSLKQLEQRRLVKTDGERNKHIILDDGNEIKVAGQRIRHVALTDAGCKLAQARREDPRTWQEKRLEEKARRRARAIDFELELYEGQYGREYYFKETARKYFYLQQLEELGRATRSEKRRMWRSWKVLRHISSDDLQRLIDSPSCKDAERHELIAVYRCLLKREMFTFMPKTT